MKVAQIAPPWFTVPPHGYGGTERVVSELCEGLVRRGHEVTLFASGGSSTSARLVTPLPHPPPPAQLGSAPEDVFHAVSAYLRAGEFDLIHDHTGLTGAAMGALLGGKPPVVVTNHGSWTPEVRRLHGLLGDRVGLVAISESQRRQNLEVPHLGVAYNGIDPAGFPYRADKEDFLCFVGRATPDKGIVEAIEIAERTGRKLVMVVKVNEPPEVEYWSREVEPRLTRDVEVLLGAEPALKLDVMSRARALLFPIQWEEPFGLVMTEAMACGTPVIACARGAAPEVVADGTTGFLVDSTDAVRESVLAEARIDVIDPAACRARVEEHFSTERMVDAYEAIYRRALGEDPGWITLPDRTDLPPGKEATLA